MDRILAMRLFVRIVEQGSFSRAAAQMDLPRASATQIIQQLEAHLGVRLLQRTTRQVSATLDGAAYYQRCVAILAEIDEAEASFSHAARHPEGRLKVDLSGSLARLVLIPALPDFFARYPDITLEIGVNYRQVDLVRESIDCVLRIGALRESSLVARRLAVLEQVSCASRAYLDRAGTPDSLDALAGHRTVEYLSASTGRAVPLEFDIDGHLEARELPASVSVNNGDAYVAACEAGFGIIQVPRYHVVQPLSEGRLVEVLPEHRPPSLPLSVLYPHHRHLTPRLRVFLDWLAERFAAEG